MPRLAVYGAISTALAASVIALAFTQRSNFFAACIYLYKSNACMMIILNLGMFLTIVTGQMVQAVFFGTLRTVEVEHLYERAWYAITEACMAMSIFREEFDTRFVIMFTVLLFLKVFHWLCQDRVDSMEQSPGLPPSFHVRMITMMTALVALDVVMVLHAVDLFFVKGPNMSIMFGFEYTLLATSLLGSFGKYVLHTIDMRTEEPWENKSMLLFYMDLLADFVKLVTYLMFFMVILISYGLPLHIIRDVYMTLRSFVQKCKDLIQYRKATKNMNERYPHATAEELTALSDPICIICREEMVGAHGHPRAAAQTAAAAAAGAGPDAPATPPPRPASPPSTSHVPKKLPCGHIFHFHCLKSWLERQQSCPTCRRLVLDPPTPAPTPVPAAAVAPVAAVHAAAVAPAGGGPAHDGLAAALAAARGVGTQAPTGSASAPTGNAGQAPGPTLANVAGAPGAGPAAGPAGPGQVVNFGHLGLPMLHPPHGHHGFPGWYPQFAFPLPGAAGQGHEVPHNQIGGDTINHHQQQQQQQQYQGHTVPSFVLPNVSHPIPGLIPLFPVDATPPPSTASTASAVIGVPTSSATTTAATLNSAAVPLTSLEPLSEAQIVALEQNTRRGLQERLRVLQVVERQILESMSVLTQAISALPPPPPPVVASSFSDTAAAATPSNPSAVAPTSTTEASSSSASSSSSAVKVESSSAILYENGETVVRTTTLTTRPLETITKRTIARTASGTTTTTSSTSPASSTSLSLASNGASVPFSIEAANVQAEEGEEVITTKLDKGKQKKTENEEAEESTHYTNGNGNGSVHSIGHDVALVDEELARRMAAMTEEEIEMDEEEYSGNFLLMDEEICERNTATSEFSRSHVFPISIPSSPQPPPTQQEAPTQISTEDSSDLVASLEDDHVGHLEMTTSKNEEEDQEELQSTLSPQDMVRKRWQQMNVK